MKHCQSFVYLINKHFYDSLTFHRVVPVSSFRGGDPSGNGTGGPGYSVPAEFSNAAAPRGWHSLDGALIGPEFRGLAVLHLPWQGAAPRRANTTIFGKVIEGMEAVRQIEAARRAVRASDLEDLR